MVQEFKPRKLQTDFIAHMEEGCENFGGVEMGLGKTVSVLTFIQTLIDADRAKGRLRRFLVVAPRMVALTTWPDEVAKWSHLNVRLGVCTGSTPAVKRQRILTDPTLDIVCTNYENLTWLCDTYPPGKLPFYGLVLDEADKLSNAGAKRFDKFRYRAHEFKWRLAMTGSVGAEGLHKMFGPVYMVTSMPHKPGHLGKRIPMTAMLGSSYQEFEKKWFVKDEYTYALTPRAGAIEGIARIIKPITFIARAKDHLDLPDLIFQDHYYELPKKARALYDELEREFVLELERSELEDDESQEWERRDVEAANSAVLKNKLRQLCSGFLYSYRPMTEEELDVCLDAGRNPKPIRETTWIHNAKVDLYRSIVSELMGEPHLAVYGYQAEVDAYGFEHRLGSHHSDVQIKRLVDDWNAGKLPYLALHPASGGHGLNLQDGGHHLLFLDLPWSRDLYTQVIKRLHRMGQTAPVIVHRLIAKGTAEQDVVNALEAKGAIQELILEAIKRRTQR